MHMSQNAETPRAHLLPVSSGVGQASASRGTDSAQSSKASERDSLSRVNMAGQADNPRPSSAGCETDTSNTVPPELDYGPERLAAAGPAVQQGDVERSELQKRDPKRRESRESEPGRDEDRGCCSRASLDSSSENLGSPDDLEAEGGDSNGGAIGAEGVEPVPPEAPLVLAPPVVLPPDAHNDSDRDSGMDAGDDDEEDEGFEDEL